MSVKRQKKRPPRKPPPDKRAAKPDDPERAAEQAAFRRHRDSVIAAISADTTLSPMVRLIGVNVALQQWTPPNACTRSVPTLAALVGTTPRTIQKAVAQLVERGLLQKETGTGGAPSATNHLRLPAELAVKIESDAGPEPKGGRAQKRAPPAPLAPFKGAKGAEYLGSRGSGGTGVVHSLDGGTPVQPDRG